MLLFAGIFGDAPWKLQVMQETSTPLLPTFCHYYLRPLSLSLSYHLPSQHFSPIYSHFQLSQVVHLIGCCTLCTIPLVETAATVGDSQPSKRQENASWMPSGEPFANLFRCPVQTAAAAPGRSLIFTHHTLEDKHLRVAFFFPSPTDASPTDEHQLWPVSAHKMCPSVPYLCALFMQMRK